MARETWHGVLARLEACPDAQRWASDYPTGQAAWDACPRGDWLIWYLGRTLPDTRPNREVLTCLAIRIVQAIPGRQPIDGWEPWAVAYLKGDGRTDQAAAFAAALALAARAPAAALALAARAPAAAIVREYFPKMPRPARRPRQENGMIA